MTGYSHAAALAVASILAALPIGAGAQQVIRDDAGMTINTRAPAPVAPPPAPAVRPIAATPTTNAMLRAGTPVALRMMEEVTTKKKAARVGQRFMMEVAEPVQVNGVTVIPPGTPAWGEIVTVRNKGMWGKSGKLDARILYLRVHGRQIRLTGTFDDKGVTGTGGVVASAVLIPLAGFFVTGTSAMLPKGATVGGFIDEDVELAFADASRAPLEIPAAAAPRAVPAGN
jgi:hypothetical protein